MEGWAFFPFLNREEFLWKCQVVVVVVVCFTPLGNSDDEWRRVKLPGRRTRKVSSMIHSARPTVSPVENIVFAWNLFCFARFWKLGMDGRITRAKTMITTGRDCGSAEWIKRWKLELFIIFHTISLGRRRIIIIRERFPPELFGVFCLHNSSPLFLPNAHCVNRRTFSSDTFFAVFPFEMLKYF